MSWTGLISFSIGTNIGRNCEQGTIEAPYRVFLVIRCPCGHIPVQNLEIYNHSTLVYYLHYSLSIYEH